MNAPIHTPLRPIEVMAPTKGKVLLAEDDRETRALLASVLQRRGYSVIHAVQGSEAVAHFAREQPSIVFIGIRLPQTNGYECVKQMRRCRGGQAATIVFLTPPGKEARPAKLTNAGGDDFLPKPLRPTTIECKITAVERIQDMRRQLNGLDSRMKQEEAMAESVFRGAVLAGNVAMDRIPSLLRPARVFSGDVLLTAYTPRGDLHVILGDFTGHGLAAALGAMPASEVFRAMTNKGFPPHQILAGINRKLNELMPTGMFFAMQLVSISRSLEHLRMCNCGMPDGLLLEQGTGLVLHRFRSNSLPLGITLDIDFQAAVQYAELHGGERLLLVSDGVLEARNGRNEQFGQVALERAIARCDAGDEFLSGIVRDLDRFCGDAPQDDDISLAEVPCHPEVLQDWEGFPSAKEEVTRGFHQQTVAEDQLEFCLTLSGRRLRYTDPIPLLINHIQDIEGLQSYRRTLFTILTELYANALDHGVLRLDSGLKDSPEGFTRYYTEREKRLRDLANGSVTIRIKSITNEDGGRVTITLTDSGEGFDFSNFDNDGAASCTQLSGRGILLLKKLCESLRFRAPGNQVEAIFSWATGAPD